tara:strand:- start:1007 stop:1669 length:663 start_codon:yes stop_codon:yes gene_type:complete
MATKDLDTMKQLVKSGNNLLSKGRLTEALTKFQTAQKDDPNNALINSSVSKIKAQLKAKKNSKRTFERYTGATPGTISKLEQALKNVQDELEKEEKKLNFCRFNVKNKIKEIKSLDKEYAQVHGEKSTLEKELKTVNKELETVNNELETVNKELNKDKDNMSNTMNRFKKVLQRGRNLTRRKGNTMVGGKSKKSKSKKSKSKKSKSKKKSRKRSQRKRRK